MTSRRFPQTIRAFVEGFRPMRLAIARGPLSGKNAAHCTVVVRWIIGVALAGALVVGFGDTRAQEQRKRKIPVVDKIAGGANRQAFTGKVETVDLKRHVLEVNHAEGTGMEIFPIKNGVTVTSAAGEKMKLDQLKRGSDVIVYYDEKDDRRSVKEIVVLRTGSPENHKKVLPPS